MINYYYDSELYHHGIKGQKWGIRRFQNEDGTLTEVGKKRYRSIESIGGGLYIARENPKGLSKILGKINPNIKKEQERTNSSDILFNGEKIGEIETYIESKKSLNIAWLGINEKQRGKKYAQKVLDYVISSSKNKGFKEITLEVPGNSPNARHIYEKKGFVAGEQVTNPNEDAFWEGLTKMRKKL